MQGRTKRLTIWAAVTASLLLIPFIAMQFTYEVQWKPGDFLIAGLILFGLGVAYELVVRPGANPIYRIAFGLALFAGLLLFWVNSAVGIIGYEGQDANFLYLLVLAIALIGALLGRFRAVGMYRALLAAAFVQFLVPLAAMLIWPDLSWGGAGMAGVFILNAFFALLFLVSAWLFRRAAY